MKPFRRAYETPCRKCRQRHFYKTKTVRGRDETVYYCVKEQACPHEEERTNQGGSSA